MSVSAVMRLLVHSAHCTELTATHFEIITPCQINCRLVMRGSGGSATGPLK